MEKKNSFILYTDYYQYLSEMNKEQLFILFHNIFRYELGEELLDMDGVTKMAFSFISAQLKRDKDKWEAIKKKRSEAGKRSGEVRAQKNKETKETSVNFDEHNVTVTVTDNVINDKEKDKKEKEPKKTYGEHQKVKLTERELEKLNKDFGKEKTLDAITFLDAYIAEKGYKSKSHYLGMRRWVFDALEDKQRKDNNKKKNAFTDFKSRTYNTKAIEEIMAN